MGTVEENKALVRRFIELYNQQELDATDEILTEGCFAAGITLEQNRQLDIMLFKAFPDWKMTLLDMIAEGDKVAVMINYTGTHTGGPFMGIPPTGKKIDTKGNRIAKIVNNKVVEMKGTTEDMLQQLGVIPTWQEALQAYKEAHNLE